MARVRISIAAGGLAVLAVVGGLTVAPGGVHAQADPAPAAGRTAQADVVTLPTGERVFLSPAGAGGRSVRGVEPATGAATGPATEPTRVRTMAVGDHFYVVPGEAMPFLGRQLDLALFDVRAPTAALRVQWAPDAAPHAIPGL